MSELWFVRHGETDWNADKRIQGWTDIPLNAAGVAQARKLAQFLDGFPVRTMYTSDLIRARATASILQRRLRCPIIEEPLLRERCYGWLEGMRRSEVRAHAAEHSAHVTEVPSDQPQMETDEELRRRAKAFLARVSPLPEEGIVLCVSHGGFIRALVRSQGWPVPDVLRNTSITRLRAGRRGWELAQVDWTPHLNLASKVRRGNARDDRRRTLHHT